MSESKLLGGRAAFVTGASRRIGRAIALEMAAAGAKVAVNAHHSRSAAESVVEDIRSAGGEAMPAMADITDPNQVRKAIGRTVEAFGRLDILVHNAVQREHALLEDLDIAVWRRALSVVLDGAFLCTKFAVPEMEKAGGGSIVFIGGASAFLGSSGPAIPTAKAGLVGLTRSLAVTYGRKGIRVNLLSPGRIEAEGDAEARQAAIASARPDEAIPIGRAGTVTEVASAAVAISGPDFSYLTGQTVHLSGGLVLG